MSENNPAPAVGIPGVSVESGGDGYYMRTDHHTGMTTLSAEALHAVKTAAWMAGRDAAADRLHKAVSTGWNFSGSALEVIEIHIRILQPPAQETASG